MTSPLRACRALGPLLALVLAGCTGGGSGPASGASARPGDCAAATSVLLSQTQRYLDGLDASTGAGPATPTPTATPTSLPQTDAELHEFATAMQDVQAYARSKGCEPTAFRKALADGLQVLHTGSPVARAVRGQLEARTAATPPPQRPLTAQDDLEAALAASPAAATVTLGPGTFTLPDTLALLRGVTLVGAGRDATRLQASAAQGTLLVLTDAPVVLRGLTLARSGTAAGPVVTAGPVSSLTLEAVRVTGGRADASGLGGVGVLMSGGADGQVGPSRRTSLKVSDSEVVGNAVAGIVVSGEHRADIERTTVSGSTQCGICFLGTADGVVRSSRLLGSGAGFVSAGDSRPKLVTSTVQGGQVGIQALDASAPEIDRVTVTASKRAAMIWTGTARGRVVGSTCRSVTFGIVVGPRTLPYLDHNSCAVARGRQ